MAEEAASAPHPDERDLKKKKVDNDETMETTQCAEGMDQWEESKMEYELDKALLEAKSAAATAAVASAEALVQASLQPLPSPQFQQPLPGQPQQPLPASSSAAGSRPPTNMAMATSPTVDWKDPVANKREERRMMKERMRFLQIQIGEQSMASDTEIGEIPSSPGKEDANEATVVEGDATLIPVNKPSAKAPPTLPVHNIYPDCPVLSDPTSQPNSAEAPPTFGPPPAKATTTTKGDRWGTEVHPVVTHSAAPPQEAGPGTAVAGMQTPVTPPKLPGGVIEMDSTIHGPPMVPRSLQLDSIASIPSPAPGSSGRCNTTTSSSSSTQPNSSSSDYNR